MKKDRWQKREEEKKHVTGTKGDSFHFHEGSAFRNSLAICRRFVAATTTTMAEAICPRRHRDIVISRRGKTAWEGWKGVLGWELGGAPADQLEVGKIEETKGQMPRDG